MHFHAWKNGLKTGCYYLRTKAPITAQKFTVDPRLLAAVSGGVASASAGGAEDEGDESSDDDDDASSVSSDEEEKEKKKKDIADFKKRLAEAKAAAEAGEECLMCGS
jgi:hypothetical protein